jgi:hypothetical protein
MAQLPTQTLSEVSVVTIGIKARSIAAGGALLLALATAPAANAAVEVVASTNGGAPGVWTCNEAGAAFLGGTLNVLDAAKDPNPPARFKYQLKALPGKGVGLVLASEQSPALALCAAPTDVTSTGTGLGDGLGDPIGGLGGNNS